MTCVTAMTEEQQSRVSMENLTATLGYVAGRELVEAGINDLFCIPGDFTMQLMREMLGVSGLKLRTMSHEYGTVLTAIGHALGTRQPSAVCFTYGVGMLNAANGIAQAHVERIPMIVLSGSPGARERRADMFSHHTIVDHGSQRRIMREITAHQEIVNEPEAIAHQMRRAIRIAREASRPVYVEIPRDLYTQLIPYCPRVDTELQSRQPLFGEDNRELAMQAAREALILSRGARSSVFVPGLEIKRYAFERLTRDVLERLALPWVASPMSRQVLQPVGALYKGVFAGPASPSAETLHLVEQCACLWLIGEPSSDVNMGLGGKVPATGLIHAYDGRVCVGGVEYRVSTYAFVKALDDVARAEACTAPVRAEVESNSLPTPTHCAKAVSAPYSAIDHDGTDGPLTPNAFVEVMKRYFEREPTRVLVTDCGDAFFMSLGMNPSDVITSSLYMSMGIAVPGAIGFQIATSKRPIVIVGDGAFQMTGLELMHARRFGTSPIVIVLNNRRWTSLSNDPKDVELTKLPSLSFGHVAAYLSVRCVTANTANAIERCLEWADSLNEPVLIEVQIEPDARSDLCERFFRAVNAQYHLSLASDCSGTH